MKNWKECQGVRWLSGQSTMLSFWRPGFKSQASQEIFSSYWSWNFSGYNNRCRCQIQMCREQLRKILQILSYCEHQLHGQQFVHSFSTNPVAQLVECKSSNMRSRVQIPAKAWNIFLQLSLYFSGFTNRCHCQIQTWRESPFQTKYANPSRKAPMPFGRSLKFLRN